MLEPAVMLVLVVQGLFHPEPVPEMTSCVVENLELVGTDPTANVVRARIFRATQNYVPICDEVIVLIFLKHEASGAADGGITVEYSNGERGDGKPVNRLTVLGGCESRTSAQKQLRGKLPQKATSKSADAGCDIAAKDRFRQSENNSCAATKPRSSCAFC
jgi:hypothetical protein